MSQDKLNDTEPQEPRSEEDRRAKPWCELIKDAQKTFETWYQRCDRARENYASLKRLAANENSGKEMQLLYANLEVLKPTIYARPPVPVCKTRFSDRKPVNRTASEVIERCLMVSFDMQRIHDTLLNVRDDVVLYARGVSWVRYKTEGEMAPEQPNTKQEESPYQVDGFKEYVCYDHLNRKDFLHEPVRTWQEVGWVARRSWLTAEQGRKRFAKAWAGIQYTETDNDTAEEYKVEKKAEVWEIWHKHKNIVVWIHPNSDEVLDMQEPWLNLEGFFPCPKPAYGVCEPDTLIPVPEYLFYKDQLDEVNSLTARIAALTEALRLKGFYSAGAEDVSGAVEKAFQSQDDNAIMVPVPAVAALGQGMSDAIVWMPLDVIAATITALVALRKQLIEDIYQISGISDIMRGDTKATETATAQNIKAQFGSVRVRQRQEEMIRVADDLMKLAGEIIAENYQPQSIMEMCQLDRLVPRQLIQQHEALKVQQAQAAQMQQQGQPAMPLPQLPPLPRGAVPAEEVFMLLRNERMRPFILQTASDSTIQPNEDAEKQRRNEFAQAVGGLLTSAGPIVQTVPEAGKLVGEMLRFVTGAYRAGREMEQVIDDFIEEAQAKAANPPPPPPDPKIEQMKLDGQLKQQAAQQKQQADAQKMQSDGQIAMLQGQLRQAEANAKMRELEMKQAHEARMAAMDERLKGMDVMLAQLKMQEARDRVREAREAADEREMEDAD